MARPSTGIDPVVNGGGEAATLLEYRAILEHAGLAILFTRDRLITRCNRRAAELFGWPDEAALVGQSPRVLYRSDEDFAALSRIARPELAAGRIFDAVFDLRVRDGAPIKAHIVASAIDRNNPRNGAIWIIDDVTAQQRQQLANDRLLHEHQIIFDQALVGIAFVRGRRIERCNDRLCEIFGLAREALIGASTRILFSSDEEWESSGRRIYGAVQSEGRFHGDLRYARADGSPIWCRVHGRSAGPREDTGTVWIIEDVTDAYLAEQELVASHRELEHRVEARTAEIRSQMHFLGQLIDAIPSPICFKDASLRYGGCNRAFESAMGVGVADLVGRHAADVGLDDDAMHDDEVESELLATGGARIYEALARHADGTLRDTLFHKAAYTDPEGRNAGVVSVMIDITEQKEMAERERLAATVFDSTADGVTITNPRGDIVAVNRAFTEITGYAEDEVLGRNPRLLQSGLQDVAFYTTLWNTLLREGRWTGEIWNRRKDGSIFPEKLTITAVRNLDGAVTHFVGVFSDITQLKHAQDALDFQAHHDALTGLPNRLLLEDRLDTAVARAKRRGNGLALLFIDLDRFKVINDNLGHEQGDLVLCEVSRRFSQLLRQSDTVARLGGDEFVVVMEQAAEPANVARVADKILEALKRPIDLGGQGYFVGASIGIALFPDDGDDRATLLKHADMAMYRAKNRGRNAYEFFRHEDGDWPIERLRLEADIRYAIARDELRLVFQPQFSLADDTLVGAEALLRWQHPERGMISPADFIPIAEETGLIVPIGEWVLREASRHWAGWLAQGLSPGLLAVNVSGIELQRGHFQTSVEDSLSVTRLPPEALELEVTESTIMNFAEAGVRALDALRNLGVRIAIDDFGTGYSSLSYLKRLPVTKLKVDRSFVDGLPDGAEDVAIAGAVLALAKSLKLSTIAEGVETEAQRQFLRDAGCDQAQGFLLGRPMPPGEFEALLRRRPLLAAQAHHAQ